MHVLRVPVLHLILAGLLVGGCGEGTSENPAAAQQTYGAAVNVTDAIPVPAVVAEANRYLGQHATVDGRITAIRKSGCAVHLTTDATPLVVTALSTDAGDCAWQVPRDAQGFAVAAGTLRVAADTLRLTANGVRVTPVQFSSSDS